MRLLRARGSGETQGNSIALFPSRQDGTPSLRDRTRNLDRLQAKERERRDRAEQAAGAGTFGEAEMFFQSASEPCFFLGVNCFGADEFAVVTAHGKRLGENV